MIDKEVGIRGMKGKQNEVLCLNPFANSQFKINEGNRPQIQNHK